MVGNSKRPIHLSCPFSKMYCPSFKMMYKPRFNHAFELLFSEYSVSMCDAHVCFPLVNLFFVSLIYRAPARKVKMGGRKRFLFPPLESQPMYNTTLALWLKSFCLTNIYWALCTQTRAGAVGHSPDPHCCLAELQGGELRQASDFSKER